MIETYKIHFGYSKRSKYYPQAVELARLAYNHEIFGEDDDLWHIVTLTEDQVDLMASLYQIAVKVPYPKIYGADMQYIYAYCLSGGTYNYVHASEAYKIRVYKAVERLQNETGKTIDALAKYIQEKYLAPIANDMAKVENMLKHESRIDYIDPNSQSWVRAKNKHQEPIEIYKRIRELIKKEKYNDAVNAFYTSLGDRYYNELVRELIYLKRIAKIPIMGRDLLHFRTESSRRGLINSNLDEYVVCIDETLARIKEMGWQSPLDILLEYAPTMEQMVESRKHEWHMGVYLWDGEFKRDSTPVNLNTFSTTFDFCPEGRLFDRYPDQIQHCRVIEYNQDPKYSGLWTTYTPSYYQLEILKKGLHLNGIEAYQHKSWKEYRGKWRKEPDFQSITTLDNVSKSNYATLGIEYTGNIHKINNQEFYEINLLRNIDGGEEPENPFLELVGEVLREAENLLREKHGIPRIGEGWVSETQLYQLVRNLFPDAEQHATPKWLRPQHLDIFVPSKNLAFEYQGKQHFEPVEYFGGKEAFENTVKRDKLKAKKCKSNKILLVLWEYTEAINHRTLMEKLTQAGVS